MTANVRLTIEAKREGAAGFFRNAAQFLADARDAKQGDPTSPRYRGLARQAIDLHRAGRRSLVAAARLETDAAR